MPYTQPFYINGPSLSSATAVFDDAALTTPSADGFYSDGAVSREQVSGVLLPEQICTTCCVDPCSGWNISTLTGTVTFSYDSCIDQAIVEQTLTGPFNVALCARYGTTPEIISGNASLVHSQNCGCCIEDCNTYEVFGVSGSVTVQYVDCSGEDAIGNFTVSGSTFCCKTNTNPAVISGTGFIRFNSCDCL